MTGMEFAVLALLGTVFMYSRILIRIMDRLDALEKATDGAPVGRPSPE